MTAFRSPIVWLLYGTALLAVVGIVHIATLLTAPIRATHDAFSRIAAETTANAMTSMTPTEDAATPFRDSAMRAALCRFDLRPGPLRITIESIGAGFVSMGMHSRGGIAFYGLNLRASDPAGMTVVLLTPDQKREAEQHDNEDKPLQELRIVAPEPDGFVTVETPNDDAALAAETLSRVHCAVDPPSMDDEPSRSLQAP